MKVKVVLVSLGIAGIVAFLFYRSMWGMLVWPLVHMVLYRIWNVKMQRKRVQELRQQFMYSLQVLNAALQAGYSMENAWKEVEQEVLLLYGENNELYQAIRKMNSSIALNNPVEKLFANVAYDFQIEEMIQFSQIMEFGKKSGGNWKQIIDGTVSRMLERYEAQREIEVVIAGKKMEQQVMSWMPLGILVFLQFSSWQYISILYENLLGRIIMTVCLGIYVVALFLGEKIMDIQV